jgi:hypothetical protein
MGLLYRMRHVLERLRSGTRWRLRRAVTRLAIALLIVCAFPRQAEPASITLSAECGGGNVQQVSTMDVTAGATVANACSLGLASSRGLFDGSLDLGVYAALDAGLFDAIEFVIARARFSDLITAEGGDAGTTGFVHFAFAVSGTTDVESFSGEATCESFPDDGSCYEAALRVGSQRLLFNGPGVLEFDLPVVFGLEQTLNIEMSADIAILALGQIGGGSLILDYLSTASLLSVSVFDAGGTLLPAGRLLSATEGLIYPSAPATPVPEPASILLLGAGLAGAVAVRPGRHAGRSARAPVWRP